MVRTIFERRSGDRTRVDDVFDFKKVPPGLGLGLGIGLGIGLGLGRRFRVRVSIRVRIRIRAFQIRI